MAVLPQKVSNKKIAWSIAVGLLFSTVGLSGISRSIAPDVLALVIFYWALIGGDVRPKMSIVFLLGLIVDFAVGGAIGIHSLKYVLLLAVAVRLGNRFQMSIRLKKIAFIVLTFVVLEVILRGVVLMFVKTPMDIKSVFAAAIWGLTWPIVEAVLAKNYSRIGFK